MTKDTTTSLSGSPWWRHSRYGLAMFHGLSLLLAFTVLRLVLFFAFKPTGFAPLGDTLTMFLAGGHRDLLVALGYTLPLLGWFLIFPNRWFAASWHRVLLAVGLFLFWLAQIFLLFVEYYFFEEFRSRFNTVAVDYLLYPHEVSGNICDSYPVVIVLVVCALLSAAWVCAALRLFREMWTPTVSRREKWLPLAGAVVAVGLLVPTINLRGLRFSTERLFNEMANNGALSFVAAVLTNHLDYAAFYKTIPKDEAYQRVHQLLAEPNAQFTEPGNSIRRRIAGDSNRPRLNVVIILEESLGSEFWGCLGRPGDSLTPRMDQLATQEGLLFTHLYASGNRTVRGLEGVLSSFPPLPGDAIVKRDLSDNVETLARLLKRDGYQSVFLYGGRGIFDGMRAYALKNGYDRFIEQKHFAHPTFATIWGVCDEDLMMRGIEEFRVLAQSGQPFFGTLLTVSNHKPFTFPKGRIPEDPDRRQRSGAVKYSDYALGEFFAAAKREPFWTNTLFVVLADHGARVYGSQSIPIRSYEIPMVILGPAAVRAPARVSVLGGPLDVAPTILGLIGRPYETLFFGRDLLKSPPEQARAPVQHNRDIGMFARERLVVLGLKHTVEFYQGNPKLADIRPMSAPALPDREIEQDTIALFQVADDLYVHQRYRLDP